MNLDELLSEIDGLGADEYHPSARVATEEPPAPAAPPVTVERPRAAAAEAPAPPPATEVSPACDPDALRMVSDLELELTVELGEARLPLKELMRLQPGDRFALTQQPDEPLKILVNGRAVAQGEPLIVDGALAVKIVRILPLAGEHRKEAR